MANWNIAHRNSIYRCVAVLKEWCFFPSLSWKIPKSFKRSIASVSPKTIPGDGLRIYWSERGEGRDVVDRRTITRPGKHTKSYWKWPWIVSFPIKNGDVQWLCKRLPEGKIYNGLQCMDDGVWVCLAAIKPKKVSQDLCFKWLRKTMLESNRGKAGAVPFCPTIGIIPEFGKWLAAISLMKLCLSINIDHIAQFQSL